MLLATVRFIASRGMGASVKPMSKGMVLYSSASKSRAASRSHTSACWCEAEAGAQAGGYPSAVAQPQGVIPP